MENQHEDTLGAQMQLPEDQETDLEAYIGEIVSAAGYERSRCWIRAVWRVEGPLVDLLCGDVLLEGAGILALVEHQPDESTETHQQWPHLRARHLLITSTEELGQGESDPTVWAL